MSRRLSLLLPLFLLVGLVGTLPASVTAPELVPAAATSYQPSLPVNAAVYYATQVKQKSKVHPTKPVDNGDVEVIRNTVLDMQYAGQQVGLYSWFGRGQFTDTAFPNHLRGADETSFRWALLNENEGQGKNPTVAQAKADLDHIYSRYGQDPSYFRVGGKPVMFLYGDAGDTCSAATRWRQADSANRFYLVMKVVPGYTGCSLKPASWYGYAPANGRFQAGNSFAVSPGFNKVGESAPRLGRSVARFTSDLRAMKAAAVRFRITTTWNEWTEATGVESASEWASRSGHGAYVDAMHAVLGSALTVPAPPSTLTTQTLGQDVKLSWSASSGAAYYRVFRDGCLVGTVNALTWTDTSLANESAAYAIKAVNTRGESRRSLLRIGTAGTPTPAPVSLDDGLTAIKGVRVLSTVSGAGVGCGGRQRGQAVISMPAAVPADATAVMVTVTAFSELGNGSVTLFPVGSTVPAVSHLRYYSTRAHTNTAMVALGTARQIVVQTTPAATHLYVDVIGYASPGGDGLAVKSDFPDLVFFNTRSSSAANGGTATLKMTGTKTVTLPTPPAGLNPTAAQVRIVTTGADGPGTAILYSGGTAPVITSLAYQTSVSLTNSVLVPIGAGNTITVSVSRNTSVILGLEGWLAPEATDRLTVAAPTRRLATATAATAASVTFPASAYGRTAMLNLNVQRASNYGSMSGYGDGARTPSLQSVSYGPQQPQSGFLWVKVPGNGVVRFSSTAAALLSADLVGLA